MRGAADAQTSAPVSGREGESVPLGEPPVPTAPCSQAPWPRAHWGHGTKVWPEALLGDQGRPPVCAVAAAGASHVGPPVLGSSVHPMSPRDRLQPCVTGAPFHLVILVPNQAPRASPSLPRRPPCPLFDHASHVLTPGPAPSRLRWAKAGTSHPSLRLSTEILHGHRERNLFLNERTSFRGGSPSGHTVAPPRPAAKAGLRQHLRVLMRTCRTQAPSDEGRSRPTRPLASPSLPDPSGLH